MAGELLWQLKRGAEVHRGGASAFGVVDVLKLKGLNVDLENLAEKPAEAYVSSTCKSGFEHDGKLIDGLCFQSFNGVESYKLGTEEIRNCGSFGRPCYSSKNRAHSNTPAAAAAVIRALRNWNWASSKNEALAAPSWDI
ncbi:MAG: hypothetical protein ACKERG_00665 [Candidatus Hodgkinia cicadicola]